MSELFLTVLNRSLTASYVILFVILVRLLLKKAPKIISYALWGVVAFRLIIPFSFESMFSLMPRNTNTVPIPHDIIYQQSPQINSGIEIVDSFVNQSLPAPTVGASVNPLQIYVEIGAYLWVIGIIALLVYSLVSIIILKKQLKSAQLIEQNIFKAKNLKTPFVLGLIKPKIYLPVGLKATERSYILLHEQTHIHRKDHIIKVLAFLTLSIHWFNPLVWVAFMLMSTDMELSCDERVLKQMNNEDVKKPYANSLLSLATGKHIFNGNPLAFGEGNVRGRIKNVLNYKKPRFWIVVVSIIAVIIVGIGLFANPLSEKIGDRNGFSLTDQEVARMLGYSSAYCFSTYKMDNGLYIIGFLADGKMENSDIGAGLFQLKDGEYQLISQTIHKGQAMEQDRIVVGMLIAPSNKYYDVILSNNENLAEIRRTIGDKVVSEKVDRVNPSMTVIKLPETLNDTTYTFYDAIGQQIHLTNDDEAINTNLESDDIAKFVEDNLNIIMSSPKTSSNPQDYINDHQNEYESFFKYGGEDALQYMLTNFEEGNAEGLRGQIMMLLCKELLGVRNNVTDDSLSPQEWYNALDIRQEIVLSDFEYDGQDTIEKLVYDTVIETESASNKRGGFIIVAPKVFGSYEEEDRLKVFVTTYSARYKLFGSTLSKEGGSIIPAAITYRKDDTGRYILEKYEQARDGSEFGPSIREYCTMPVSGKKIKGLEDEIFKHYTDYGDIRTLLYDNLYKHLKKNGITDATLTNSKDEIEFSMSNPKYNP
ncbi:MAG: M56 family metallopeptidase [Dehalobacterium sp.]